MVLVVTNLLVSAGEIRDAVPSLGREDPLEEGVTTHSSILAWRIPSTEDPDGTVHGVTTRRTQLSKYAHMLIS